VAKRVPLILVVEDDTELLKMLGRMLSELADVELARDGVEAVEKLQTGISPDLVITDLMMPRMDGLTLAKQLKMEPQTKRTPVIMLTAKNGARDVVAGINAGARSYITKPFKHEELLNKVRAVLNLE
jgi:DNA-binding response OmpR family regulator